MLLAEAQYKAGGTFIRTLKFLYDEHNAVVGISVKNAGETRFTGYYYAKNLQGDVVAMYLITVEPPRLIATYEYDEWGKVKTVRDATGAILTDPAHLANRNPFRYRSYHYDTETGFYYLQSRYYDPVISRFINADEYASTGQGFIGTNMFAYCGNNPIIREDMEGSSWWDNVKKFGQGFADGFTNFFQDTVATIKNIPTIVKDAVEHPVDALKSYAKSAFWGVVDPFGGRRKIYNAGKALFVGDAYALGHVVRKHTAESAVAIAAYGAQAGMKAAVNTIRQKVLPKIVNSKLFGFNNGYGLKIGKRIEILYQNPSFQKKYGMIGGTFISICDSNGKCIFRLNWDPRYGLHTHPPGHK